MLYKSILTSSVLAMMTQLFLWIIDYPKDDFSRLVQLVLVSSTVLLLYIMYKKKELE